MRPLTIGTRGSPLALVQARGVQSRLAEIHDLDAQDSFPLRIMTTSGDRFQDRPLSEAGGKGLFVRELDQGLIDGDIDIAVHSLKDVPTRLPKGIVLAAFLPREDPRDAFVSHCAASLDALPQGASIGTASLRRAAQVRALRPDLEVVLLRGNVQTRLNRVKAGDPDATFLAMAGLKRLSLEHEITDIMDPQRMVPAACQGIVAIACHEDDADARARLSRLNDPDAADMAMAERAALAALDGSCRTPIGAHARLDGDRLELVVELRLPDGTGWRAEDSAARTEAAALGAALGSRVRAEAGSAWPP